MYKIIEQRMYSEVVYYSDSGTELGRETMYDDHLYDSSGKELLTEDEMSDWGEN